MAGTEEPTFGEIVSDEASGVGANHLKGLDFFFLAEQIDGPKGYLGTTFPGISTWAFD